MSFLSTKQAPSPWLPQPRRPSDRLLRRAPQKRVDKLVREVLSQRALDEVFPELGMSY